MNITKALLLTFLLIIIFLLIQIGFLSLLELFDQTISLSNPHQKWISKILGFIISYLVLFKVFWKVKVPVLANFKLNNYKISILMKTYPFSDSSKLHNFSFFIGSRPNENSL